MYPSAAIVDVLICYGQRVAKVYVGGSSPTNCLVPPYVVCPFDAVLSRILLPSGTEELAAFVAATDTLPNRLTERVHAVLVGPAAGAAACSEAVGGNVDRINRNGDTAELFFRFDCGGTK